jgi:amino-acid N-acetyltransferase
MIIDQAQPYRKEIVTLLAAEKLPVEDLPESLDNFIVAIQDGAIIGVAGVEIYGVFGLLRSLAVRPEYRSVGIAGKLLGRINAICKLKGLSAIYLLTETAPGYFEKKRFLKIGRDDVPSEVQRSSEFSHVCPVSAIVMRKELN